MTFPQSHDVFSPDEYRDAMADFIDSDDDTDTDTQDAEKNG